MTNTYWVNESTRKGSNDIEMSLRVRTVKLLCNCMKILHFLISLSLRSFEQKNFLFWPRRLLCSSCALKMCTNILKWKIALKLFTSRRQSQQFCMHLHKLFNKFWQACKRQKATRREWKPVVEKYSVERFLTKNLLDKLFQLLLRH